MELRTLTLEEWGELLPDSGFEPFHLPEALAVIDEYEDGELRLLGGFRGQQPVGLLPLFVRDMYSLRFVVSPPPGLSIPWLGPILMPTSPKQRKRDKLNERFTEAVLEEVRVDNLRTVFGLVASRRYADPRPYSWAGLSVDPRFNFVLNLADREQTEVLDAFTRDLRSEIRKRDELDISISIEGPEEAKRVCGDLKDRHAEQGLSYPTPREFAGDLVERLDDYARVYVARTPDGDFLSGITVLYSNDNAIFWQGGTKANYQGISVNSILHWKIIEDILGDPKLDGVEYYNLGNAKNRRIARYKSKFNASPLVNYEIKSALMILAKQAYMTRQKLSTEAITERFLNRE